MSGKGDKDRTTNKAAYRANFDAIKWDSKRKTKGKPRKVKSWQKEAK